jgi:hypothetical protein
MTKRKPDHFLEIRLEGEAVGSGRISLSHLLCLLSQFNKALQRSAMVQIGREHSLRRGPRDMAAKDMVALDLVQITHGSPATVLGFERRKTGEELFEPDAGQAVIETALAGLVAVQQSDEAMPAGCDAGVLMAWRDAGVLFRKGVKEIQFTLNRRQGPLIASYTAAGFARLQGRIQSPQTNIRTIEGRLLMADFKEHGTRCRVHPSVGDPILCLFDEEQKEEVLEDILQYVRIVGETREEPTTGRIASIKIHDIERLEDREGEFAELLPQGTPLPTNFWQSPTIEELAASQDVAPLGDVSSLYGTWPGQEDDRFEESIHELRLQSVAGGSLS